MKVLLFAFLLTSCATDFKYGDRVYAEDDFYGECQGTVTGYDYGWYLLNDVLCTSGYRCPNIYPCMYANPDYMKKIEE